MDFKSRNDEPDPASTAGLWAQFVYDCTMIVAGIIVLAALITFSYKCSIGEPSIPLVVAAVVWFAGRFQRHVAGRPRCNQDYGRTSGP